MALSCCWPVLQEDHFPSPAHAVARRGNLRKNKWLLRPSFNKSGMVVCNTASDLLRKTTRNVRANLHAAGLCCRRLAFLLLTRLIAGRRGNLQDINVSRKLRSRTIPTGCCEGMAIDTLLACAAGGSLPVSCHAHCRTMKLQKHKWLLHPSFNKSGMVTIHAAGLCCRRITFRLLPMQLPDEENYEKTSGFCSLLSTSQAW